MRLRPGRGGSPIAAVLMADLSLEEPAPEPEAAIEAEAEEAPKAAAAAEGRVLDGRLPSPAAPPAPPSPPSGGAAGPRGRKKAERAAAAAPKTLPWKPRSGTYVPGAGHVPGTVEVLRSPARGPRTRSEGREIGG